MAPSAIILLAASAMTVACSPPARFGTPPSAEGVASTSRPARTEEQVRKDLASEGYNEIHELKLQSNGSWTALAVLDGKEKQVMITPNGFVFPR